MCGWKSVGEIVGSVFHLDEGLIISSSQPPSRAVRALSGHNYH